MSISRLTARVPSAVSLGHHVLWEHDLRFHKVSSDGSGKCDAFHSGCETDTVHGVLFEICPSEKPGLDSVEGLGFGYDEKIVAVISRSGALIESFTYVATHIEENLTPYSWYLNHVLVGAREAFLPEPYIQSRIRSVQSREDSDRERDAQQRAIHVPGDIPRKQMAYPDRGFRAQRDISKC